jgi:hypothetical protein
MVLPSFHFSSQLNYRLMVDNLNYTKAITVSGTTYILLILIAGVSVTRPVLGVYIAVVYCIHIDCDRGMMKKALHKDLEFCVEIPVKIPKSILQPSEGTVFDIRPDTLKSVNKTTAATLPKFHIIGKLHHSKFPVNLPFTGELTVKSSETPLKSIELQLVRVETVILDGKTMKEASEIQNIQICEGNICHDLVVPMYMVFPRLYSCPTVITSNFRTEFEVNLIVVFRDGNLVAENFPILLSREIS